MKETLDTSARPDTFAPSMCEDRRPVDADEKPSGNQRVPDDNSGADSGVATKELSAVATFPKLATEENRQLKAEIDPLNASYTDEIARLNSVIDRLISQTAQLDVSYTAEIKRLNANSAAKLMRLNSEIAQLSANHTAEIEQLNISCASELTRLSSEIAQLSTSHAAEIKQLNISYASELTRLNSEIESLRAGRPAKLRRHIAEQIKLLPPDLLPRRAARSALYMLPDVVGRGVKRRIVRLLGPD